MYYKSSFIFSKKTNIDIFYICFVAGGEDTNERGTQKERGVSHRATNARRQAQGHGLGGHQRGDYGDCGARVLLAVAQGQREALSHAAAAVPGASGRRRTPRLMLHLEHQYSTPATSSTASLEQHLNAHSNPTALTSRFLVETFQTSLQVLASSSSSPSS